jgi:hypothetical protein
MSNGLPQAATLKEIKIMKIKRILHFALVVSLTCCLVATILGCQQTRKPQMEIIIKKIDTLWMNWDTVTHRFTPELDTIYFCQETNQHFKLSGGN